MSRASRFLPARLLNTTSKRLSQYSEAKILPLRDTFLRPHLDKLYYTVGDAYNLEVFIDIDTGEFRFLNQTRNYLWWIDYIDIINPRDNPVVIHTSIYTKEGSETTGHAILLIYFPKENAVDMVTTYSMELSEESAIQQLLRPIHKPDGPVLRDVSCLINAPVKLRDSRHCYNLQDGDTAEIGWCAAWMMEFTRHLSEISADRFWAQPWAERKSVYKEMYDSFVSRPNYTSLEVGRAVWNGLLERYNEIKRNEKLIANVAATVKRTTARRHTLGRNRHKRSNKSHTKSRQR